MGYRNCLDDTVVDTLVEYFYTQPSNSAIASIHMSHNRITDKGCRRLLEAAAKCRHYPRHAGEQIYPLWLRLESNAIENPIKLITNDMKDYKICLMNDGQCSQPGCDHYNVHVQLPHFVNQDPHNQHRNYEHGVYDSTISAMVGNVLKMTPQSGSNNASGGGGNNHSNQGPPGQQQSNQGNQQQQQGSLGGALGNMPPGFPKAELLLLVKGMQKGKWGKEEGQKCS